MTRQTVKRTNKKHPGLSRAAKEFGVAYGHLWRVATGRRVSHRLTARYAAWREAQSNAVSVKA